MTGTTLASTTSATASAIVSNGIHRDSISSNINNINSNTNNNNNNNNNVMNKNINRSNSRHNVGTVENGKPSRGESRGTLQSSKGHNHSKRFRSRQRGENVKSSSRPRPHRENTRSAEVELTFRTAPDPAPLLPPIGLPGHLSTLAIRGENTSLSPRALAAATNGQSPQHVASSNALSRLTARGPPTPDNALRTSTSVNVNSSINVSNNNHNNTMPDSVFNFAPKTPVNYSYNQNVLAPSNGVTPKMSARGSYPTSATKGGTAPTSATKTGAASPELITPDKAKIKFEKKLQKTLADSNTAQGTTTVTFSTNNNPTQSPRQGKVSSPSAENAGKQPEVVPSSQSRESRSRQRKSSTKSIPKAIVNPVVVEDQTEPFSIRRKIEQFRKWHEEQYTDELKKLKSDGDPGPQRQQQQQQQRKPKEQPVPEANAVDYSKILEETITQNRTSDKFQNSPGTARGKSSNRPKSAMTWKTWRGVNESDAYTDVKKYIEDNDLMDDEKAKHIQAWIGEVHVAMEKMRDETQSTKGT